MLATVTGRTAFLVEWPNDGARQRVREQRDTRRGEEDQMTEIAVAASDGASATPEWAERFNRLLQVEQSGKLRALQIMRRLEPDSYLTNAISFYEGAVSQARAFYFL